MQKCSSRSLSCFCQKLKLQFQLEKIYPPAVQVPGAPATDGHPFGGPPTSSHPTGGTMPVGILQLMEACQVGS